MACGVNSSYGLDDVHMQENVGEAADVVRVTKVGVSQGGGEKSHV